jgi:hypothetical protein
MAFYPSPFLTALDPKPLAENMQSRRRHAEAGKQRGGWSPPRSWGQRLLIPPSMMSSLPTI